MNAETIPSKRRRSVENKGSLTLQCYVWFRQHPGQWIDGKELSTFLGFYAWRSRVADCRKQYGMQIENSQTRDSAGRKRSLYRYVPPVKAAPVTQLDLPEVKT